MKAMVLESIGTPLKLIDRPDPIPGVGEIRLKVEACAICRTDLHVVDGDLPHPNLPVIPGHEIVGVIDSVGEGVASSRLGRRVGVPWLGHTCGHCPYCAAGSENLCDQPLFTGYTRDGGFASHVIADEHFAFDLDADADAVSLAPLLCAGLIGWRCLNKAGEGKLLAIYGFGAAAHIIAQIAIWQDREVFAFTRPGDEDAQAFARSLGATWAGGSDEHPPKQLDAAIIFAPVGALVPNALRAVRKGGRVVCGGIHMSDIPAMPYRLLWEERELVSVANLTRHDAEEFFPVARSAQVRTHTKVYPLEQANQALDDLRAGRLSGAAVLVP
ncbi:MULTISPECIES: zinc-dependent alcohol dehydrogenase family protein [unclassified Mesorhizobium]|uniref:zinc-dependent alcohol dehydrogenase family protein n=1 Tax=unclassified Mesorhizobium TaxID=325217 RepID=UPI000FCAC1DE|nr:MULTISPECIES: zinc-dependent alcohol dehydrogenase family protein [unclassified Mesorhizobium]RUV55178.1 zinc-binding alcohol dehydrogenase family protein [Mesorhizobium sp. M5C.F.Ca.IN.020.29.1.1]RWB97313.1 MAG: zinc-binding alcohol dehydrogenase family protein [Mesorhizobium sp.]RWI18554.1 MAG: zinc-binding alcohol dehydrogenase family protein [Mesorhizobium sp.]RWK45208.1 MAG: zinc-binding alcohol dehydrogenase family protein [Mesorhizobium sp.]RWK53556.1 MAG: zinc-binding alcohol dehydr